MTDTEQSKASESNEVVVVVVIIYIKNIVNSLQAGIIFMSDSAT